MGEKSQKIAFPTLGKDPESQKIAFPIPGKDPKSQKIAFPTLGNVKNPNPPRIPPARSR